MVRLERHEGVRLAGGSKKCAQVDNVFFYVYCWAEKFSYSQPWTILLQVLNQYSPAYDLNVC